MLFPPAFSDITMDLSVHLAEEARIRGSMCYIWMYPLKGYVRNKAKPKGSIAEGYIAKECMAFFSQILEDVDMKLNLPRHHERSAVNGPPSGLSVFRPLIIVRKVANLRLFLA